MTRPLTEYEKGYIERWTVDYCYSLEIIELALKKSTSKSNFSFNYFDGILSDWHERNLKTTQEIENYLSQSKAQASYKKNLEKSSKYNNFEQRTYDNFDNFYANSQN